MRNDKSTLPQTAAILVSIMAFVIFFVKKAIKAGRIKELLISTPILILVYYIGYVMMNELYKHINISLLAEALYFVVPLGIYALYWLYLFSHEKITSLRANLSWANRSWWWDLDGWEFEEEVAKVFRLNGYKVRVTKKTGDGGADIIMYKDDLKYIVQCKHYKNPIPVAFMRELNGIMDDFGADMAIMVASSGATKQAEDFIENKKAYFRILDLEDIIRMGLRPLEK